MKFKSLVPDFALNKIYEPKNFVIWSNLGRYQKYKLINLKNI